MAADYSIEIETSAAKALAHIAQPFQTRIATAIAALAINPRPHGCTKLSGRKDAFRIRIGNYRVVYTVNDLVRIVRVEKIAHRREVYR
jgi:mRNA interferase RelE/StbE